MNRFLLLLLLLLSVAACSNQAMYDTMRHYQRDACNREVPPQYAECIAQTKKPYKKYKQERNESLERE